MSDNVNITLSEFVLEYLEGIPGGAVSGGDASNSEEYFKLNMEIQKTLPDYKKCIEYSAIILKEKSKDLKVAVWFCFALFRTEKVKGLRDGLSLILQLLKKYGSALYPANEMHRSKSLQFLNSTRFYKLVEKEDVNKANADQMAECLQIFNEITSECEKNYPGNMPVLNYFAAALKSQHDTVLELRALKKDPVSAAPIEIKKEEKSVSEKAVTPSGQVVEQKKSQMPSEPVRVSSEKDAILQLKKILLFFFEDQSEPAAKERIPEFHLVFGLSRQLQWGRLHRPPDLEKVTQIEAPNQVIQGKLKEWYSGKNWDRLIPRIEMNFLKGDSEFQYWLDPQRYAVKALEQLGGNYSSSAEEIKKQLGNLVARIPDLPYLKFKDKSTPFADGETLKWINDEVLTSSSPGKAKGDTLMPPILGEEYDSINTEYIAACAILPDKFEENVHSMQEGIYTDTRRKGKFLRRLNLANYCYQANEFSLAKVHLAELDKQIDEYNLEEWEPALCTAAWQAEYLTNVKLISAASKEQIFMLDKEQKELFAKIAKYNGILALKLTKKNK